MTWVNIAGGEFGEGLHYGFDFVYPQPDDIALAKAMGGEGIRVPVQTGRLPTSMSELKASVTAARAAGLSVVIDLHDFGSFLALPRDQRAYIIAQLILNVSTRANSSTIAVELGNEPVHCDTGMENALDTRDDLRAAGFKTRFLVPSRGWSGVQSIVSSGSADLFRSRPDPLGNSWLVGHWYGDADNSGGGGDSVPDAADRLDAAIATGLPLAITEAGVIDTPAGRAVWAKFHAKVAKAKNVKMVAVWQLARWAPNYHMALRADDGTATRLFHMLMWQKGVCP